MLSVCKDTYFSTIRQGFGGISLRLLLSLQGISPPLSPPIVGEGLGVRGGVCIFFTAAAGGRVFEVTDPVPELLPPPLPLPYDGRGERRAVSPPSRRRRSMLARYCPRPSAAVLTRLEVPSAFRFCFVGSTLFQICCGFLAVDDDFFEEAAGHSHDLSGDRGGVGVV